MQLRNADTEMGRAAPSCDKQGGKHMKKLVALLLVVMMTLGMASFASADEIKDLRTYETTARELETWNIQYSQNASDLNVLCNLFDGLLTNDASGALVPCAAKEWSSPDGGKTWVFTLNDGMVWSDKDGNVKADMVANDWLVGLEWVLNYAKNDAYNTSMPMEMIVGATEYYKYTKTLADEQGTAAAQALGLDKFLEMVGIKALDDKTIQYTCTDMLAYFPTVATYNCLYPLSAKLIEEVGVEGYRAITWENMWYSGPYVIESYVHQNEKVFVPNKNYYNKDIKVFDSVTCKMVESLDTAFELFLTGELDHVQLTQANLNTIHNDPSNEFYGNLVEMRPTKYSYQMHLIYDKNNEDGTPDTNWNTAIANEAFRLSVYYGLDLTAYLARANAINPLKCQNFAYTHDNLCINSQGVDYTQLVRDELGLNYNFETFARADAEKAAAYKKQAIEELTAKGVTFPVEFDYYIQGNSQTALDTAQTIKQLFSDYLGDDYATLNICTYISSLANEVRKPQLASFYINGWGADFGDPINFVGQETYGEDSAYYSNNYSMINKATDPDLIATYQEYTRLVNEAKGINDDMDARYAAFAKAEAYMLSKALVIPMMYEVAWQLTCVNDYTKIYSLYGMQAYRYINYETNDQIYTTAEYAEFTK